MTFFLLVPTYFVNNIHHKKILVSKSRCCERACANANKFADDLEHDCRVTDGTIWIFLSFFSFPLLLSSLARFRPDQGQPDAMQSPEQILVSSCVVRSISLYIMCVLTRLLGRRVAVNNDRSVTTKVKLLRVCAFHKVTSCAKHVFFLLRLRFLRPRAIEYTHIVHLLVDHLTMYFCSGRAFVCLGKKHSCELWEQISHLIIIKLWKNKTYNWWP